MVIPSSSTSMPKEGRNGWRSLWMESLWGSMGAAEEPWKWIVSGTTFTIEHTQEMSPLCARALRIQKLIFLLSTVVLRTMFLLSTLMSRRSHLNHLLLSIMSTFLRQEERQVEKCTYSTWNQKSVTQELQQLATPPSLHTAMEPSQGSWLVQENYKWWLLPQSSLLQMTIFLKHQLQLKTLLQTTTNLSTSTPRTQQRVLLPPIPQLLLLLITQSACLPWIMSQPYHFQSHPSMLGICTCLNHLLLLFSLLLQFKHNRSTKNLLMYMKPSYLRKQKTLIFTLSD